MSHTKYYQGKYKPKNPKKYKGDPTNIIYRSSWELSFMRYCDRHPGIIEWASEEMIVPYISPIDNKPHRYFPDFVIKTKDKKIIMIEIKPKKQTVPPKLDGKKVTKSYINEVYNYGINNAKWEAARAFCKKNGWEFKILSEDQIKQ